MERGLVKKGPSIATTCQDKPTLSSTMSAQDRNVKGCQEVSKIILDTSRQVSCGTNVLALFVGL